MASSDPSPTPARVHTACSQIEPLLHRRYPTPASPTVVRAKEVPVARPSAEQSSVNNNIASNVSGTSSQEMRLRSDLWHDVIHSTGQIFVSVEHLRNDLTKHLADNFAKFLRGKCSSSTKDALIELLKKVAYVMTAREFENTMVEMRELCVQGELWARKENPNYWANAFFQGERYGEMYSNPAESFNSWEMNCDFFMWCDKLQSFVDSTTPCEKDEKIKQLENRIAWLEDELRGSKSLINKAKVVVQSLPKTFAFLSIQDKDGDDGSDETFTAGPSVQLKSSSVRLMAIKIAWLKQVQVKLKQVQ
ncbi:hypothetical protein Taro_022711, partial [Colocasia esculenta]|nr:hypothetical protein [Colocasia esculenta]